MSSLFPHNVAENLESDFSLFMKYIIGVRGACTMVEKAYLLLALHII
jgi:hypothetical protein